MRRRPLPAADNDRLAGSYIDEHCDTQLLADGHTDEHRDTKLLANVLADVHADTHADDAPLGDGDRYIVGNGDRRRRADRHPEPAVDR